MSNCAIRSHGLVIRSHGLVIRSLELDNSFSRIAIRSLELDKLIVLSDCNLFPRMGQLVLSDYDSFPQSIPNHYLNIVCQILQLNSELLLIHVYCLWKLDTVTVEYEKEHMITGHIFIYFHEHIFICKGCNYVNK